MRQMDCAVSRVSPPAELYCRSLEHYMNLVRLSRGFARFAYFLIYIFTLSQLNSPESNLNTAFSVKGKESVK